MAGPLSTNEIEDVVSSVRRLVSPEQRPRPLTRDLAADKLLLTPSLRVVADNVAAAEAQVPLILSKPVEPGAEDRLHLVDAEWEDQLWTPPEAPLAELALGAEEAEVVTGDPVAVWPEAEADWVEEPVPDPMTNLAEASPEDELDVAEMLTAAVVEDDTFRSMGVAELQDLVRAMVRDELQGSLGERITRNVRKLVRAEINRALAARALD